MVEVVVAAAAAAEGQWEWQAFFKEVCQSYAQLEMAQQVVQLADPH